MFIGIDLGGTHMRAALVDRRQTILDRRKVATHVETGPEAVRSRLVELCRELAPAARKKGEPVSAIGLGVAGKIDPREGRVIFSPNLLPLNDYPLACELQEQTRIPVYMENDANLFGLGEQWLRADRGIENWLGVTLGTGVGGCLILGGRLWSGDHLGFSAEIGHTVVDPAGPECVCGLKGCLEAHSSARALVHGVAAHIARGELTGGRLFELFSTGALTAEAVYDCAKQGSTLALGLFQRMGWALGLAIGSAFTLLGIRCAIIGGGVSAGWDLFIDPLCESLREHCSMLNPGEMVVQLSERPNEAALLGAARLAQIKTGVDA
jgi:glucokinase